MFDGCGVECNLGEVLFWFKMVVLLGYVMVVNMFGCCYEYGWGVLVCDKIVMYWYVCVVFVGFDWG